MVEQISVVVVDDHSLFRAGVIQSLSMDDEIKIVGEGSSGDEALELVKTCAPDLILLDISMPGNGVEAAAKIFGLSHSPKVVMLTVSEKDDDIMGALEAGAVGYILKGIGASDLIEVVKSVAAGDSFVSPNLTLRILSNIRTKTKTSLLSSLSGQEERTLRLVAMGLSNREVGERLGVLEKTVKYHMTRVMEKLNVRNRVEATLIARREWKDLEKLPLENHEDESAAVLKNKAEGGRSPRRVPRAAGSDNGAGSAVLNAKRADISS